MHPKIALINSPFFYSQESLEVLRQNLSFVQSLQKVATKQSPENSEKPFDCKKMGFYLSQWIDVKDTIDQWLEAQVTKIRETQIYVHYNGWGNHWDEWIDIDSPRIAPFRTYTLQYPSSRYLSPAPNITPDAENHEIPVQTAPRLPDMVNQVSKLVECLQGYLNNYSELTKEEEKLDKNIAEFEKLKEEHDKKIRFLSAQIAPMLDRTGRLLADFAPHFAHIANPEEFKDEPVSEPLSYNADKPDLAHDKIVPLIANPGDITIVSNLLDRVIFSDSPSLEVHVHAFLNPPGTAPPEQRPRSVNPLPWRTITDPIPVLAAESLPGSAQHELGQNESAQHEEIPNIPNSVETEMQTESKEICDSSTNTENILTHTSVGVQTGTEPEIKVKVMIQEKKEPLRSPIRPKIKAHVGHTIIRESPRVTKGKIPNNTNNAQGEFRITKTNLKMGPMLKKSEHK